MMTRDVYQMTPQRIRARRRNGQWLGSRCDGAARRAQPAPAAHTILAPHDLIRRSKTLDNVPLGFHGSRCRPCQRRVATSPRGFPGAAKRATIAGMSWHHIPKDDAWKQAHLAMLAKLGKRAWLHCDDCRHSVMIEPHELAHRHRLDMLTPLLTISKAMRCTRCGARKGCCWPEPHNTRRGDKECAAPPHVRGVPLGTA